MEIYTRSYKKKSLFRLGWPVSNAWLMPETEIGPVLIDTGHCLLGSSIVMELKLHGFSPRDLSAIILTHRHSDHAGNAAYFKEKYGIPVYAHRADAAALSRQQPLPKLPVERRAVGVMCLMENLFPAPFCSTHLLEDGDQFAGFDVHWVPGHTAGSIFLYHRETYTLFSGDALLNAVPPLTFSTRLALPYREFSEDYPQALRSLASFQEKKLEIRLLCAGHGPPRPGPVYRPLDRLLRQEYAVLQQTQPAH